MAISCALPALDADAQPAAMPVGPDTKFINLNGLTPEQRAFIASDAPLRVVHSRERLEQELARRSPEQMQRYVADMMGVLNEIAFQPGVDMAEIPLNPEADNFNGRMTVKPAALWEYRRDAGPIQLSRYLHGRSGVPTFAGAPVAVYPEDLIAGDVDVAIVGVPQSMSSGNRDGRNAPNSLRLIHGIADRDLFVMTDPGAILNMVDYGDFAVDRMSVARTVEHVVEQVSEVAATGAVPFLVGGDATVTYSGVRGVRAVLPEELTLVHLGAHFNARPTGAHELSDQVAIYRLLQERHVSGRNLIQVGLRGPSAGPEDFQWMREQRIRYHTMAEVERSGWPSVMTRVLEEATERGNPVYITVDVSVLDPSELAAAARAVPGGLRFREVQPLLRRLCAENEIVGFEIMDLAPMLDLSYVSSLNANYMMNACLSGMAARKAGFADSDYLDPVTLDHGQP
jgi:agmatinase